LGFASAWKRKSGRAHGNAAWRVPIGRGMREYDLSAINIPRRVTKGNNATKNRGISNASSPKD
jgi:hypothetical protein